MTHVLVVDDDADIRSLLTHVLLDEGYEVSTVDGGRAALTALARPDRSTDVVLLDVQMPDLDGWDTLWAIRSDPQLVDTPVLLCTVKGREVDRSRGRLLRCDGYITKPFNISELLAAVEAVVDGSVSNTHTNERSRSDA